LSQFSIISDNITSPPKPTPFTKFNTDLNDLFEADEQQANTTRPDHDYVVNDTLPTSTNASLQHITDFLESVGANQADTDLDLKPPVIVQTATTATSTPMRSILKKNLLCRAVLLRDSPIGCQLSQVGMSQALGMLVDTPVAERRYSIKLSGLPYGFYYRRPDVVSFELVSTVEQLFEADDVVFGAESSGSKKRKLRFDESSIQECSAAAWGKAGKKGNFANLSEVVVDDEEINEYFEMVG
jgi:hypothetical protein